MEHHVFNNSIGSPISFDYPRLTQQQEDDIIAALFEQLLIFDQIVITTNRLNFALVLLIKKLGINIVERMLEKGLIKIMIWSPLIVSGTGRQFDDGTKDISVIYGQPPLAAGSLSNQEMDPEQNIKYALDNFPLHRDRKRIFSRIARDQYIVPKGMEFSTESAKFIIDAYKGNDLERLGLKYEKEPDQLDLEQRALLLKLGHKVIETAILSKYDLKSYENYEHYAIGEQGFENIGKAYKIADNSSVVFNLEGLPNLKQLFLSERLSFEDVFKVRYLPSAKYYRNWINNVGENKDATEITTEYLNEIKGTSQFFASTGGKFLRNLGMFAASTGLGAAVLGAGAGAVAGLVATYGLSLLDTFWIDNLLKGNNASMFIEGVKNEVKTE